MAFQYTIRPETALDEPFVRTLVARSFSDVEHSAQTEHLILDALRQAGELSISLVAERESEVIGHVAFSPVAISDGATDRFGLGPIAVDKSHRLQGIGRALIEAGLAELRRRGAKGCVVLGDPALYRRFGFCHDPAMRFDGAPAAYFMALHFGPDGAKGDVTYSPAFFVTPSGSQQSQG